MSRKPRPVTVTLQRIEGRGLDELRRPYWRLRGPDPETGRRTTLDAGRWTESEANELLEDERARARLGLSRPDDSQRSWTVSQVVAAAVEELGERLGPDHHHTLHETRRLAHVASHLGSVAADRVTTAHLERYASARRRDPCRTGEPVARRSLQEEIAAWQRAVRTLRDLHRVEFGPSPMPALKSIPDDARPQRRLTEAEVGKLLRAAELDGGVELWSLLTVLAWSGRRPVAVFAATHGDCVRVLADHLIRTERLMFWSTDKGGIGRGWGPLTDPAYHALRAVADQDQDPAEPLWMTSWDNPWDAIKMNRVFERVATRAGVGDVQLYDLRRFSVTRILDAVGGKVARAQRFTGHKTVSSLLRYVFSEQGEAESAAPSIGWSAPRLEQVEEGD